MKILGDMLMSGSSSAKNFSIEALTSDPTELKQAKIWFNVTEGVFKFYDGDSIEVFSSRASLEQSFQAARVDGGLI
jgi:hypothetical protein